MPHGFKDEDIGKYIQLHPGMKAKSFDWGRPRVNFFLGVKDTGLELELKFSVPAVLCQILNENEIVVRVPTFNLENECQNLIIIYEEGSRN